MSTLTEIKAEAIALHVLGHSCRNIEGQLKVKFPNAGIPNYGTISRWVRVRPTAPIRKYRNLHTTMRWWQAAQMAAEIVHDRLAVELENVPYNKVATIYGRMMDVVINLERLNNQGENKQG